MREVRFFVDGIPVAQGSKRAMMNRTTGKPFVMESNSHALRKWRRAISDAGKAHTVSWLRQAPLHVGLRFVLPRKNHPAGEWCAVAPDIDKLMRAVLDGLTGSVLVDDAQVVKVSAAKVWGDETGVFIIIRDVA
jgi:Holliday junction resolvase RusA-like endonuclease